MTPSTSSEHRTSSPLRHQRRLEHDGGRRLHADPDRSGGRSVAPRVRRTGSPAADGHPRVEQQPDPLDLGLGVLRQVRCGDRRDRRRRQRSTSADRAARSSPATTRRADGDQPQRRCCRYRSSSTAGTAPCRRGTRSSSARARRTTRTRRPRTRASPSSAPTTAPTTTATGARRRTAPRPITTAAGTIRNAAPRYVPNRSAPSRSPPTRPSGRRQPAPPRGAERDGDGAQQPRARCTRRPPTSPSRSSTARPPGTAPRDRPTGVRRSPARRSARRAATTPVASTDSTAVVHAPPTPMASSTFSSTEVPGRMAADVHRVAVDVDVVHERAQVAEPRRTDVDVGEVLGLVLDGVEQPVGAVGEREQDGEQHRRERPCRAAAHAGASPTTIAERSRRRRRLRAHRRRPRLHPNRQSQPSRQVAPDERRCAEVAPPARTVGALGRGARRPRRSTPRRARRRR